MGISDFYSALFLIIGGFAGLLMIQITGRFQTISRSPNISMRLETLRQRFESRQRWSWVMVIFGTLWLLQLVLEGDSLISKLIG